MREEVDVKPILRAGSEPRVFDSGDGRSYYPHFRVD